MSRDDIIHQTFLSDRVSLLLRKASLRNISTVSLIQNDQYGFPIFNTNLVRDKLLKHFDLSCDRKRTIEWYDQILASLSSLFFQCYSRLKTCRELPKLIGDHASLGWLTSQTAISEIVDVLQNDDGAIAATESLLLLTPVLERSLGNVLLAVAPTKKVPSMLKDLLVEQSLTCLWKDNVLDVILHLLLATPRGLNLRNLAWHGFIRDGDISPTLTATLVVLLFSLSNYIPARPSGNIRPVLRLHKAKKIFNNLDEGVLTQIHIDVRQLARGASSILCERKVALLDFALQSYEKSDFRKCLVMLLPEWEFWNRFLFCRVNSCQDRLLTAEADTLYTTFDEMLDQSLPNGKVNEFLQVLGTSHIEFLFDILILPEGPRLRDKLSHGEVDLFSHDSEVFIQLQLCCQIILASLRDVILEVIEDHDRPRCLASYSSQYHPCVLLKEKLCYVTKLINDVSSAGPWPDCNEFEYKFLDKEETCSQCFRDDILVTFCHILRIPAEENFSKALQERFQELRSSTLYRPKVEYELVSLWRRIVGKIELSLERISENLSDQFYLFRHLKLRSRQRVTYRRMLETAQHVVHFMTIVSSIAFVDMNYINTLSASDNVDKIIRSRKNLLKIFENISENAKSTKNRWKEIDDAMSEFLNSFATVPLLK